MEKLPFTELGLSPELLKAVDKMGFEEAAPIQAAVIPAILRGRDVVGMSSTGSGKTAAFAIPAIERVDPKQRAVQVLILCPTRELAVQVAEETGKLAHFKRGVMGVPIYGGQSYERQFRALAAGVQVVIGTPGRVMDHMDRGTLKLENLKLVILDEADRMLDMGFREDIEKILSAVPEERQLLFFSATMPRAIQDLIGRYSRDPEWIKIESVAQNAPQVEQTYFEVDRRSKIEALTRLIDVHDFRYGIIFCSTKIMVDDLDEHLHARGYATDRLHGDISQAQRDRVMEKFRRRAFEFLVATDVAA
ncbi:MAG TPA: DEAD/DEAH box helicase, partial [Opitutus sp.]|nr:DEAD/DEAH box helicase [Opitutus sp.]